MNGALSRGLNRLYYLLQNIRKKICGVYISTYMIQMIKLKSMARF